jgi:hypothetical protein
MQIPLAPHPSRRETGDIFAMTMLDIPVTATAPPIAREDSKKACPTRLHALGRSTRPNAAKGTRAACIQVCHQTLNPKPCIQVCHSAEIPSDVAHHSCCEVVLEKREAMVLICGIFG